jgi:hypothetical protein
MEWFKVPNVANLAADVHVYKVQFPLEEQRPATSKC